ncbi:acyltransferase [Luteolibacter sp. LG18]|uniref:acyltransferase n=1 Tax=Luteolibacter sp. LG18 TaxID=2819286 RepID=UPI002B2EB4DB|nr:hypothetical protein llg_16320 [Luteolibacter sp. LG18]
MMGGKELLEIAHMAGQEKVQKMEGGLAISPQEVSSKDELEEQNDSPRFGWVDGFDYLRVFFMISVILNHCNFVTDLAARSSSGPNLWDFFHLHVQSCAVPVFVLVSMLLFVRKPPSWDRLTERLRKLGYLYVFWVGAWMLYTRAFPILEVGSIVEFLLRGGGWVFYFIASLILCSPLAWFASRLPLWGQWVGFFTAMGVIAGTFAYLAPDHLWTVRQYYWLPTCFMMMPFAAVLITPHSKQLSASRELRFKWIAGMMVIAILFAVIEWHFAAPLSTVGRLRSWLPKHARLSIQFGAIAFVFVGFGIRRHPHGLISFLARNSLGIYCMHPFVLGGFIKAAQKLVSPHVAWLAMPVATATVVFCCGMASEFLRRAFRHRLV